MKIKKTPSEIWTEYQRGVTYNTGIGLYDNVERNNNFYNDKQWEGVNAPDLDKPVFNFLKTVVSYYVAMLISDDIAVNVELTPSVRSAQRQPEIPGVEPAPSVNDFDMIPKVISREIDNILEKANVRFKNRKMLKNCAIDGDGCFYIWFDPDAETGFDYKGEIKVDLVDNTNVLFGNPSDSEVQEQPFVLIAYRRLTDEVREEMEENGGDPEEVQPDNESIYMNADKDNENNYTTVLLKMWKEAGTVRIIKTTQTAVVKKEADTGYKRYPLAYMNWESVKNCYHGISPLTGKIANQIFVNKIYAMAMVNTQNNAFPKVIYNRTKIPVWSNKVGTAIAVNGDPNDAIFANFRAADMSADALNMAATTVTQTKEMMGASDAALGNVKNPDNGTAIIAVQKAAGMPLDIQRMDFYNFVEDTVRIFIEMMRVNYGKRKVAVTAGDGDEITGMFDFGELNTYGMNLNIDIGQGSFWSEMMQVQTLDALMSKNIITDPLIYFDAVPDGLIKNKNKIVEQIKEQRAAAEQIQQTQAIQQEAPMQTQEMMPREMPVQAQESVLPEPMALPQRDSGELSEDEVMRIAQELASMGDDEAMAIVEKMRIADADKEKVVAAYAAMTEKEG